MKSIIDRETYNGLEIFNSPDASIFSILNSTKTEGGERLLNEMMQEVMDDVDEIAARRDLIKFFCRERMRLMLQFI